MNIRFINATTIAQWRAAGIKVDVLYATAPDLYAVRVHDAIRSGDLP